MATARNVTDADEQTLLLRSIDNTLHKLWCLAAFVVFVSVIGGLVGGFCAWWVTNH